MLSHIHFEKARKLTIEAAELYLEQKNLNKKGRARAEKLKATLLNPFIDKSTLIIVFLSTFGKQEDGLFGVSPGRSNVLASLIADKWFLNNEAKVFPEHFLKKISSHNNTKIKARYLIQHIIDEEFKLESRRINKAVEEYQSSGNFLLYSSGIEKLISDDFPETDLEYKILKCYNLAKRGNVSAQVDLAIFYTKGQVIEKDEKEAIRLFHLAAEQGNAQAQFNLALFYEEGEIVKDRGEAIRLYRLAAEKNHRFSQFRLARCYENGIGVKKDIKEALRLYELSATENVQAQSRLGWIYENGFYDEKNTKKASYYFHLLAEQIQTKTGKTSLSEIKKNMDKHSDSFIPKYWPLPIYQKGPCCALYAFANTINYGLIGNLYARKEGNKIQKDEKDKYISVRKAAKELKCTTFGAIFDRESFDKLTGYFGISNCENVNTDEKITQEKYINTICDLLKKGNAIIASCDLQEGSSFPGNSRGEYAHWVTIFGYYYYNEKCRFLVTHLGNYSDWDAEELYRSNDKLPDTIPDDVKKVFYKEQLEWGGKIEHCINAKNAPTDVELRQDNVDSLKKFRFSLFKVPNKTNIIQDKNDIESGPYLLMDK